MSEGLRYGGSNHESDGNDFASSTSPSKKERGMPCMLPDALDMGVLMSACASTQTMPVFGLGFSKAGIVPMGMQ